MIANVSEVLFHHTIFSNTHTEKITDVMSSTSGQSSSCSDSAGNFSLIFFQNSLNRNGPPKPPARKKRPKTMLFNVSGSFTIYMNIL